jgi:hypothetical protein
VVAFLGLGLLILVGVVAELLVDEDSFVSKLLWSGIALVTLFLVVLLIDVLAPLMR